MVNRQTATYMYVVEFEKSLSKGVLNGLTIKDRLHFASEKDANRWVRDVQLFDNNTEYLSFNVKPSLPHSTY